MSVATKRKRASDARGESDCRNARSRGGEKVVATDIGHAAANTTLDDYSDDTDGGSVERAADDVVGGTGDGFVRRKNKAGGDGLNCATDGGNVPASESNAVSDGQQADSEMSCVAGRKSKRRTGTLAKPSRVLSVAAGGGDPANVTECYCPSTCLQLITLQSYRVSALRSRIMLENRIRAQVALTQGYRASMEEGEREKRFKEASEFIKRVTSGGDGVEGEADWAAVATLVIHAYAAIDAWNVYISNIEKQMVKLLKTLPIAAEIDKPEFRGFGHLMLAKLIGECGDLSLYSNPAKVWKRMGCAPHNGKMPSTWRSGKEGKLTAEDWTAIGYCPRRRSEAYLIGENIVKQNGDGPYRKRYNAVRAIEKERHPDWPAGRCHSHAMLLATKQLIRDVWIAWRK